MTGKPLSTTLWPQVQDLARRLEALHQEHRWHGQLAGETLEELCLGRFKVPETPAEIPGRWTAPEEPATGPAADVHALAALAYEVLTGHQAFPEGARQPRSGGLARPSDLVRGLSSAIDLVLLDALDPEPAKRPVVRWLRQAFEGVDPDQPDPETGSGQTTLLVGTGVAGFLLGAGLTLWLVGPSTPVPALRQSIGAPAPAPIEPWTAMLEASGATASADIAGASGGVFAVEPSPVPTPTPAPTPPPILEYISRVVVQQGVSASFNARMVTGDGLRVTVQVANGTDHPLTLLGQDGDIQLATREGEDLTAWVTRASGEEAAWTLAPGEQQSRHLHVGKDLAADTRGLTLVLREDGGPWNVRLTGIREEATP